MDNVILKKRIGNILGVGSIIFFVILLMLILSNAFYEIPILNSGIWFIMSPFLCPVGVLLGLVSWKGFNDNIGKWGTKLNLLYLISPVVVWLIAFIDSFK